MLGAIFVVIVVFMPEGLVPGSVRLARWVSSAWRPRIGGSGGTSRRSRGATRLEGVGGHGAPHNVN